MFGVCIWQYACTLFRRDCGSGCGIHRCICQRRRDLVWRHGCGHLKMGGTVTTDAARNSLLFLLLLLLFGMLIHATNMAAAASITASSPSPGVSICMREGCNCTNTPPHWLIVTCSFSSKQASGYLPNAIAGARYYKTYNQNKMPYACFSKHPWFFGTE